MKKDKDDWNMLEYLHIFEFVDWALDLFLPFLPFFAVLGLGILIGWGIWH